MMTSRIKVGGGQSVRIAIKFAPLRLGLSRGHLLATTGGGRKAVISISGRGR